MTSPQKQEGQHDAEADSGLPGNPLASQVRDAPKPEDLTTDALTSSDNSADLEARLAAHQDAFRGSSATPGSPTSDNLYAEAIAPDQGEPRAATTTRDEPWDAALSHTRTQTHLAASEDVVRGSTAAPGIPAAGHLSTERTAPDRDEPKEAITQANEPTTKYLGDMGVQPRRAARLDLEVGNVDFHPGMPLAEDLSVKMREADREEHDLEDQSGARARMSCANSDVDRAYVSFSLDSHGAGGRRGLGGQREGNRICTSTTPGGGVEADMNFLSRHNPPMKPPTPMRSTAAAAAAAAVEMVTVQAAFMKWHARAKYEKGLKSHPVLPSRQRMKTPISGDPTRKSEEKATNRGSPVSAFDAAVAAAVATAIAAADVTGGFSQDKEDQPPITPGIEQMPTPEMPTSKFEEKMKATSFGSPAFASEGEKRAVATADPTKIFSLDLEDISSDLSSHKDSVQIKAILCSKTDHTLSRWRRRAVYTEENFDQWAEWAPVEKTHRDAFQCMNNLSKENLLIAPTLRSADPVVIADAWNTYRKHLIEEIQQALLLGCAWKRILTKLHLAFSDPEDGYPRLKLAVDLTLKDSKLMQFPLLHADVLIYKLDASFAEGTQYEADSFTSKWSQTTCRNPGEDPLSLAIRVQAAYLDWWDSLDEESLYQLHAGAGPIMHSHQVRERYISCLQNDEADPVRGARSAITFQVGWAKAMELAKFHNSKSGAVYPPTVQSVANMRHPTLESVVRMSVAIDEPSYHRVANNAIQAAAGRGGSGQPLALGLIDEKNSKERRREARLHLQPAYNAEPPPYGN